MLIVDLNLMLNVEQIDVQKLYKTSLQVIFNSWVQTLEQIKLYVLIVLRRPILYILYIAQYTITITYEFICI